MWSRRRRPHLDWDARPQLREELLQVEEVPGVRRPDPSDPCDRGRGCGRVCGADRQALRTRRLFPGPLRGPLLCSLRPATAAEPEAGSGTQGAGPVLPLVE